MEINDIKMFAEGPLYEGSNTVQGEINNALDDFLKANNIKEEEIGKVVLKQATVYSDSLNFDLFQSILLQLASDNTEMIKLAAANPVSEGKNSIQLQVASEQEKFEEVLKQKKLFLIADANVIKDSSCNIDFKCKLEFEIETK